MQLAESQWQHLFDLVIACDRPRPDSDALVKKGLAQRGKGHFGEWVRITQKGIDLVKTLPEQERINCEARWIEARSATHSTRTVDRGGRATSSVVLRADASPTEQQSMPAAAVRTPRTKKKGSLPRPSSAQQPAPSTPPAGGTAVTATNSNCSAGSVSKNDAGSRSTRQDGSDRVASVVPKTTSSARVGALLKRCAGGRNADEVVPNAVRIIRANKVTYYPVSMFGSLHDASKQRCRTTNRYYRTYSLAASEPDQVVL